MTTPLVILLTITATLIVFGLGMTVRFRIDNYKSPVPGIRELAESIKGEKEEPDPNPYIPPKPISHLGEPTHGAYDPSTR